MIYSQTKKASGVTLSMPIILIPSIPSHKYPQAQHSLAHFPVSLYTPACLDGLIDRLCFFLFLFFSQRHSLTIYCYYYYYHRCILWVSCLSAHTFLFSSRGHASRLVSLSL